MYKLHCERRISTSHQLTGHEGKCKNLHGHSMLVEVDIRALDLIKTGSSKNMVVDFGTIKKIIDTFDHAHINDIVGAPINFKEALKEQPTAEILAHFYAEEILKWSGNPHIIEVAVKVHEEPGQYAEYCCNI